MKPSDFDIYRHFNSQELHALKLFYDGLPARQVRSLYCDPWPVLARHRALPKDQYEAVRRALEPLTPRRRNVPVREVAPDDPIYRAGFLVGGGRMVSGKQSDPAPDSKRGKGNEDA